MTEARYRELSDDQNAKLTPEELAEGWHFCNEYDGLLVGPGMDELRACLCLPKQKLHTLRAALPPTPYDSDGCYTLPNGDCVSPGPCPHTPKT